MITWILSRATAQLSLPFVNGFRTLLLGSAFGIVGYAMPASAQTDAYGNKTPDASNTGANYLYNQQSFPSSDNGYVRADPSGNTAFIPAGGLAFLESSYTVGNNYVGQTVSASGANGLLSMPINPPSSTPEVSLLAGNYITPSSVTLEIENTAQNSYVVLYQNYVSGVHITNENAGVIYLDENTADGVVLRNDESRMYVLNNSANSAHISNESGSFMNFIGNSAEGASVNNDASSMNFLNNLANSAVIVNSNGGDMVMEDNTANNAIVTNETGGILYLTGNTATGLTIGNTGATLTAENNILSNAIVVNNGSANMVLNNNNIDGTSLNNNDSNVSVVNNTIQNSDLANANGATMVVSGTSATGTKITNGSASDSSNTTTLLNNTTSGMTIENYGTMGLYGNSISGSTLTAAANAQTTIGDCSTGMGCTSNTGSVIQNTTFTNNGTSTVTGGVQLSGSTIINNAALNLSNTALTGGGDLTNAGTITMSGNNSVESDMDNNGTVNVVSGVSALSGALDGNGAMSITDASVLLSGNGAYTGSISVQNGVLNVSGAIPNATVDALSGGTIQGNGTIGTTTLASGSIISPVAGGSIGTLTINGNLTVENGAKYIADGGAGTVIGTVTLPLQSAPLNSMASDLVSVTGSVNLEGGDVSFASLSGKVAPGQVYRLLTAGSGISGRFSGLTTPYVFLSPALLYSTNAVDVLLTRNALSYSAVATTRNQFMAGVGVDGLSAGHDVALALDGLTAAQVRPALDSLSGEVHASARTALIQDSFFVRQSALDRLDTADCDGSIADSTLHTASLKTGRRGGGCLADQPVIWGEAYGSLGHNSGNGNAANMNHSTAGFIMGMDTLVAQTWRVGGLFGYGRSMFDVGGDRGSSGHSNNVTVGGYAGTHWGGLNLRLGAAYTWNMLSMTRNVTVASFGDHLSSDYLGGTAQAFGELGYKFHIGHGMVEPFGNLAYVNQQTNRYNEQGGAAALHGRGMDTGVTFSTFGIKASSLFHVGKLALVPHGTLAYRHAFGLSTPTAHEMFRQARYGDMDIAGVPLSVNAAVVDAGLTAKLTDRIDVGLSYTGQYGNQSVDSGARAQARFRF